MEALSWALNAVALLLLLYAIRVMLQGRDPEHPGRRAGLGCGFFFLACLFWSLALAPWVDGYLNGFRLGMGVFLAFPALGALAQPHGGRLVLGVVGLLLGILLAAPVASDLWAARRTAAEEGPRRELDQALEELSEARATLQASLVEWEVRELELKALLQQGGHADFDALAADPAAMAALEELATVSGRIEWGGDQLALIDQRIAQAEARLEQLSGERAGEGTGLESLGFALPETPAAAELTPVEEYARRKELQALWEREVSK